MTPIWRHRLAALSAALMSALATAAGGGAIATPACVGDCGGTQTVTIADLILGVSIALGVAQPSVCPAFQNSQGQVTIAELVRGVENALNGCDTPVVPVVEEFAVPAGARPHDVAPAADGGVWYTAQRQAALGYLDPASGSTRHIPLGSGAAPHGVIVGPDGAPWITDGGLNAIVRVDPASDEVTVFALPVDAANGNLNTATFDPDGVLWFTGQNGIYGRLDPDVGQVDVFAAPRGRGPYGIATSPNGEVYFASLAGSYVGWIDRMAAEVTILEPPTAGQGARRVWPDSSGRIWVSEWNAGQLAVYDPRAGAWQEWRLPGDNPRPYAVYVDDADMVWLSDFAANAMVRFDPATETFASLELPSPGANVRQILGRPGEVWGAESGVDKLVVIRTRATP